MSKLVRNVGSDKHGERIATVGLLVVGACAVVSIRQYRGGRDFSGALEEIVVTARRQEESLQDVPLAINAVTGDTLRATGQ